MQTVLKILAVALNLLVQFTGWLRDRQMLEAGKAQNAEEGLRTTFDRVDKALAARDAARADNDRLREHGGEPPGDKYSRD